MRPMKSLAYSFLAITSFILTNLSLASAVKAVPFSEKELDPNSIIAIARPYGEGKYDLLVIEQLPRRRQCWQENGSNPIVVDPLLSQFDFTDSCLRSTDSNGYSLRVNGEDLGLDYLFRIVERDGELWLVGTSRRDKSIESKKSSSFSSVNFLDSWVKDILHNRSIRQSFVNLGGLR